MANNEKFFTDQEFETNKIEYIFAIFTSRTQYQNGRPPVALAAWDNNNLTRNFAQNYLQGIVVGASIKYKQPFAVLYATTPDGTRQPICTSQD